MRKIERVSAVVFGIVLFLMAVMSGPALAVREGQYADVTKMGGDSPWAYSSGGTVFSKYDSNGYLKTVLSGITSLSIDLSGGTLQSNVNVLNPTTTVAVSGITSAVTIANPVNSVAVSGITAPVTVVPSGNLSGITNTVTVAGSVAVSGITGAVTVANPVYTVAVSGITNPTPIYGTVAVSGITGTSQISFGDTASIDAFARIRMSSPYTLFDSKQTSQYHNSLFWDTQITGSGATAFYTQSKASTTLRVPNTAARVIRQTYQRFNYQTGKSQLSFITFDPQSADGSGVTKYIGLYDDADGIYLKIYNNNAWICKRSSVSGVSVDTEVIQSSWNVDKFDGTGASGFTLSKTHSNIFFIDYEWLGVGRVRTGFVINGIPYYAHTFNHANQINSVYMSTPNLPVRYEIVSDGTGVTNTLDAICCSVMCEGGVDPAGVIRGEGTHSSFINANTAGVNYAIAGVKLRTDSDGAYVQPETVNVVILTGNDAVHWELLMNPTVAGTFVYSGETNSVCQVAIGDTAGNPSVNTVTGGTVILDGYATSSSPSIGVRMPQSIHLGKSISGTLDSMVLVVSPMIGDSNVDVSGSFVWREVQ